MTTQGMTLIGLLQTDISRVPFSLLALSWIPAFAEMTAEAGHHFMQALQLLAKQHHAACPHHPGSNDPVAGFPKLP